MRTRRGFTLVEFITVIVIIGIISAAAMPAVLDLRARSEEAADQAALAGVETALIKSFLANRMSEVPASAWIAQLDDVRQVMESRELPDGLVVIDLDTIEDRRGTVYVPTRWALVSLLIRHLPSIIFRRLNF